LYVSYISSISTIVFSICPANSSSSAGISLGRGAFVEALVSD